MRAAGGFGDVCVGGRGAGRGRCSHSPPTWARSLGAGPKLPPEPPTCPRCHGNDSAHVDEEEREERRGEEASRPAAEDKDGRGPTPAGGQGPRAGAAGPVPTPSACLPLLVPSADDLGCRCGSAPSTPAGGPREVGAPSSAGPSSWPPWQVGAGAGG